MGCFTGMGMVLFPLMDVIDLIIDGIFCETVSSNSNNVLSKNERKTYKTIFSTFVGFGVMAAVINIGVFLVTFIRRRKIAYKEDESSLSLHFSSFITCFKDLPQIIVCLLIVFKTKYFLNAVVQVTKAIITIQKSLFHLLYFCFTKREDEMSYSCFAEVFGNVLLLVCGVVLLAYLSNY